MTLWVCAGERGCGTKYAVGLFRCPRCHNNEFVEDGQPMAKITVHGGASDATLPEPDAVPGPAAAVENQPAPVEPAPDTSGTAPTEPEPEGGEESSPGDSSSASTSTPPTKSAPSETPRPSRARKTANHSAKAPTDSSTAPTTDGGPTEVSSAPDTDD